MIAIHTRSLVIFCSIVITLVFATKNEWAFNQESRRVIFCGIFLAVINGANQFFYRRYVSVQRNRETEENQEENLRNNAFNWQRIGEWFANLKPEVQVVVVTSCFGALTGMGSFFAKLIHLLLPAVA